MLQGHIVHGMLRPSDATLQNNGDVISQGRNVQGRIVNVPGTENPFNNTVSETDILTKIFLRLSLKIIDLVQTIQCGTPALF
jgi:hypothetical protein